MKTAVTSHKGLTVTCERDHDLKTLTRSQCRECSLCNYGRNCNGTDVNPQEFDKAFEGNEPDFKVYNIK
jgi:hypothetical protein